MKITEGFTVKSRLKRVFSFVTALILLISAVPFTASANGVTFEQIVNASTYIIIKNEGNYSTVVKNDVGAMSIGVIGWHATNALNLLKDIIARNPSQALNILGAQLYNEIITSSYWETRIATAQEASVISVLLSTAEGKQVQDETAAKYISGYVQHGQSLGITEPEALVFFADYQNQNGYTGAENFFYSVKRNYNTVNLTALYNSSSKNNRRTRTYNFCATVNWNDYSSVTQDGDKTAPSISNVSVSSISESGYTVTCNVDDNEGVVAVYFAIYYKKDGAEGVKWYSQTPVDSKASHTVSISEFSSRAGEYCTYIYAFDKAGNYAYAQLNTITVPEAVVTVPELTLTVSSVGNAKKGDKVKWNATATSGSGNYLYSFSLIRDNKIIARRNYSDYNDFEYTLDESGIYKMYVTVKDAVSGKSVMAESTETGIFEPIVIDKFQCSYTAALVGQFLQWDLSVSGGEGELKYSYTVYKNDVSVYSTAYSQTNLISYKPTDNGVYYIVANIMDSRSQTVSVKSNEVTVISPLAADNVEFSSDYAVTGKSVKVNVNVSGGTGVFTCNFKIYCDGKEVISSAVNGTEFTFTVPKGGNYTASITVIDADTTITTAEGGNMFADEKAKRGDANCDGNVSASDARFALRCAARLETIEDALKYAVDVNDDGRISASDARIILRISARLEN